MMLNENIRNYEKNRIANILKMGLKKSLLVTDDNGTVLESNLDYNVDSLSEVLMKLIEMYGQVSQVTDVNSLKNRYILLDKKLEERYVDLYSDLKNSVSVYTCLSYPDGVEAFLNDISKSNNNYKPLDNNSILGGFDDDFNNNNFISFNNCSNIDLENIKNYFTLKFIFDSIRLRSPKNYIAGDIDLMDTVDVNNLMLTYLKRVTHSGELDLFKDRQLELIYTRIRKKNINE